MTQENQALPNATPDQLMSRVIGNLLRFGVLLSSLLVVSGGVLYLFRHGSQSPQYHQFIPGDATASDLGTIWKDILHGRGRAIIRLGLLILMATPVVRIAVSVIWYILEKDRLYTLLTLVVLAIVLSGIFGVI